MVKDILEDQTKKIYIKPANKQYSFTSYCFYNELLPSISEHYKYSKSTPPVLSLEKLTRIDPMVLPNLIGLGYYLRKYHKKPIRLDLSYEPKLLYYLHHINFFNITGNQNYHYLGMNIFDFDKDFIGGFSDHNKNPYREKHKVHYKLPDDIYNNLDSESAKIDRRDETVEMLSEIELPGIFSDLFEDLNLEYFESLEACQKLAEPISNGILHSKSPTFFIMQLLNSTMKIAISDVGIGFENSLVVKNINFRLINIAIAKKQYTTILHDYYMIWEVLYYSMIKKRLGIFDFVMQVILEYNGSIRIHYNSTQIIITTTYSTYCKKLYEIRKEIISYHLQLKSIPQKKLKKYQAFIADFAFEIIKNWNGNLKFSPLRFMPVKFSGIHLEMELNTKI